LADAVGTVCKTAPAIGFLDLGMLFSFVGGIFVEGDEVEHFAEAASGNEK